MIRLTTPIHFSHSYLSVSSSRVAPVPQLSEATFCSADQAADRGWGIAEGGSDDRAMTDHDLFVTDRDRPAALRRSFDRFDCRAPREGERETAKKPPIYEADRPRRAADVAAAQRFAVLPWFGRSCCLPSQLQLSEIRVAVIVSNFDRRHGLTLTRSQLNPFLPSACPSASASVRWRPSRWRNADNRNGLPRSRRADIYGLKIIMTPRSNFADRGEEESVLNF